MSAKSHPKNKNEKKAAATRLAGKIMREGSDQSHLEEVAARIVDPRLGPFLYPQMTPGRLGCATFPLVVELVSTAANPLPSFGAICKPSINEPFMVSDSGISVVELAQDYTGNALQLGTARRAEQTSPCPTRGKALNDTFITLLSFPLRSAAGATFTFNIADVQSEAIWDFKLFALLAGVWFQIATVKAGGGLTSQASIAAIAWNPGYTDYGLRADLSSGSEFASLNYQYTLQRTAGTSTCTPAYNEAAMKIVQPAWSNLIAASKHLRVVACDMLITYEGSTLDNAGSIAIANVDESFTVDSSSIYETVASLPFDKYRGRLASEGQTEGGAHWHYVPSSVNQLFSDGPGGMEEFDVSGVAGVQGLQQDQVVRIECHFTVNFYSQSPEYTMAIPPSISGLSPLLWLLRTEVPLVSSNDKHSITKSLSRNLKKGLNVATSPEVLKLLSMLALAI